MKKKIIILGVNGGFGSVFCNLLLKQELLTITGVDLGSVSRFIDEPVNYCQSNLAAFDEALISIIQEADIIIACLPEHVAYQFLQLYIPYISDGALVIDTLSIKNQVAAIYTEHNIHALSLNPMFGPDLSPAGRNIIVISFKESELSKWFIGILSDLKLNLVFTTSDEHDRLSSLLQVATHAAIMTFGVTLAQSGQSVNILSSIATPPFLSMSTLYGRIALGNKEVYWNIQKENDYASDIRKALINNLTLLDQYIDQDKEEQFNQMIEIQNEDQLDFFKKLQTNFSSASK